MIQDPPMTQTEREARRRMEDAYNATPQGKVVLVSRDDLRLLLAASGMGEWRPIETAPRDATWIIAYCVHANAKYVKDAEAEGWVAPTRAQWIDHNGGGWTWHGMAGRFTHWIPMPEPPPLSEALAALGEEENNTRTNR